MPCRNCAIDEDAANGVADNPWSLQDLLVNGVADDLQHLCEAGHILAESEARQHRPEAHEDLVGGLEQDLVQVRMARRANLEQVETPAKDLRHDAGHGLGLLARDLVGQPAQDRRHRRGLPAGPPAEGRRPRAGPSWPQSAHEEELLLGRHAARRRQAAAMRGRRGGRRPGARQRRGLPPLVRRVARHPAGWPAAGPLRRRPRSGRLQRRPGGPTRLAEPGRRGPAKVSRRPGRLARPSAPRSGKESPSRPGRRVEARPPGLLQLSQCRRMKMFDPGTPNLVNTEALRTSV